MSSFVINKKEYVKAAGFMAALAEQKNLYREPIIYWYSYSTGGILTATDYYNAFVKIYNLNAKSVQLQYNDKKPQEDSNEYMNEFDDMRAETVKLYQQATIWGSTEAKQQLTNSIFEFSLFARSINYQIEDRKIADEVNKFMNKCQMFLLNFLATGINKYDGDSWSTFNLAEK